MTLAEARGPEIVEICREAVIPIVEDIPYGMLSFEPRKLTSLHELDPEHVIYLGSFSKVLAPGLRVGWAAAPEWIRRPLQLASESTVICASPLSQALAADYIAHHDFRGIIAHAAAVYAERAAALIGAFDGRLPEGSTLTQPHGGFFSWVTLPEGWTTAALLDAAIEEQVVFVPAPRSVHRARVRENCGWRSPSSRRSGSPRGRGGWGWRSSAPPAQCSGLAEPVAGA